MSKDDKRITSNCKCCYYVLTEWGFTLTEEQEAQIREDVAELISAGCGDGFITDTIADNFFKPDYIAIKKQEIARFIEMKKHHIPNCISTE